MFWRLRLVAGRRVYSKLWTTPRPNVFLRPYSSTETPIASTSKPAPIVTWHVRSVEQALLDRDLHALHQSVPELLQFLSETQHSPGQLLSTEHFRGIVSFLASSARPYDLALLDTVTANSQKLFGVEADLALHSDIARLVWERDDYQSRTEAFKYLSSTPSRFPFKDVPLSVWKAFMRHCADSGDTARLRRAYRYLMGSTLHADNQVYEIYFKGMRDGGVPIHWLREAITYMGSVRITHSQTIEDLIVSHCENQGRPGDANKILARYKAKFIAPDIDTDGFSEQLCSSAKRQGLQAALRLYETTLPSDFHPTSALYTRLVSDGKVTSVREFQFLGKSFGLKPELDQWRVLLENLIDAGNVDGAAAAYNKAIGSGIQGSSSLAEILIHGLCQAPPGEIQDKHIARAVKLLSELPKDAKDVSLYALVLNSVANAQHPLAFSDTVATLVEEMDDLGLSFEDSTGLAASTSIRIRAAPTFDKALSVYQSQCQAKNGPRLDAAGYALILDTVRDFVLGDVDRGPSVGFYFRIVADMRSAGFSTPDDVYASLLQRLSSIPYSIGNESHLADLVRKAQAHIKLDATFNPDLALLNQLLDTYFRLDCWKDGLNLWESMRFDRQYNNRTVALLVDASSQREEWDTAVQICKHLHSTGFKFSKSNWDAWVEVLIKSGDLNNAVRIVCLDMGKSQSDEAQPDIVTVRLLLRLTEREDQREEIRARIRKYKPALWDSLPTVVKDESEYRTFIPQNV